MITNENNIKLFLIVLGGQFRNCNIELHDVRWICGRSIQDTYEQLKQQWFGARKGLHIDSYLEIKYIDGFKINLTNRLTDYKTKKNVPTVIISKTIKGKGVKFMENNNDWHHGMLSKKLLDQALNGLN